MKKSKLNDNQLEDLLKQLPKIQDNRDPRDIYQNVSVKLKKRRRKRWIMPSVATASVLILILILSANMTNRMETADQSLENNNQSMKIALKKESSFKKTGEVTNQNDVEDTIQNEEELFSLNTSGKHLNYSAIYEDEIKQTEVLTFAIPDQQAQNIVPISVLVPNNPHKTKMDLFQETMVRLTEEKWGLEDYYPLAAKLEYRAEQNELRVDVPLNHSYGTGSAAEETFQNVLLNEHDSLEVDNITLFTEGKPGIEFDNKGIIDTFPIRKTSNHGYYFFYPNNKQAKPYLIPFQNDFSSIKEALTAMKKDIRTHDLKASIPNMMDFEYIDDSNKTLTLHLTNNSELKNNQSTVYTIEAILLTAKDFNFGAVEIKNAPIHEVGKFILDHEIKVPVAANKQTIDE